MIRLLTASSAIVCLAGMAIAADTINTSVVSVAGNSAYLGAGRDHGVFEGARVVFRLASGATVEATVVDVTSGNARAEFAPGVSMPMAGDRADVEIESAGPVGPPAPEGAGDEQAAGAEGEKPAPPAHAPWRTQVTQDPNAPLLAPAFGTRPDERPMTVHGRSYSVFRLTDDLYNDSNYIYARSGLWLDVRNPLGDGGRLLFQGETDYRNQPSVNADNEGWDASIQRFSYAWGIDREAPFRGEVGRFISVWLPELGIFDGAEGALRLENGLSIGAGTGYYPTTTEELPTAGEDWGFHTFIDYQDEFAPRLFQATLGYQQTFHSGDADRSVVIGRVIANPSDAVRLFGMAMVDLYDSTDTLETSAAEVTQAVAQGSFRFTPTSGGVLSYIHTSWPELERDEFAYIPPWLVTDGYVDRLSGTWWTKLDKDWRMSMRGNWWQDQSREGYGGELSFDVTLPIERPSMLYTSIYYDDSAYTSGAGFRLQGQTQIGDFNVFLGYDGFMYTTDTDVGGDPNHLNNMLRSDITWGKGQWYWDVDASYVFGDDEEAISVGVSVQYRF